MSRDDEPPARRLYPFRKQDPLTLKWYRARWKASLEEIAAHGWKVDGPPMIIGAHGDTSAFMSNARADPRPQPPMPDLAPPDLRDDELWLARLFLRRYVTWCARRGQEARARHASTLWRHLGRGSHPRRPQRTL
jgi:hypothetical protein